MPKPLGPKRVIEIWGCPICDADVQKTETRGDRRCPNGHWLRWGKNGPTDGAPVHYPARGWVRFRHLKWLQVVLTPDHAGPLGRQLLEGEEVMILGETENGFYHVGFATDGQPEYVHMFFVVIPFWLRGKKEAKEAVD